MVLEPWLAWLVLIGLGLIGIGVVGLIIVVLWVIDGFRSEWMDLETAKIIIVACIVVMAILLWPAEEGPRRGGVTALDKLDLVV